MLPLKIGRDQSMLLHQALKFLLVGCLTTAVTFFSFLALYRLLGVNEYAANLVSYILGLINSYLCNKVWTFQSRGFKTAEIAVFLAVFGLSYLVQLGAFALLIRMEVDAALAQILAMAPYTLVNFLGNRWITFRADSARGG
jgi:putative flippase GtrA